MTNDEAPTASTITPQSRGWTDREKELLKEVLGISDNEVEKLLRWVAALRQNSATTSQDELFQPPNPLRWSS